MALSFFILSNPSSLYGYDADIINEEDLFSDSEIVIGAGEMVDNSLLTETDKPSISLSGSVYTKSHYYTFRNDYTLDTPPSGKEEKYTGSLTANLLLDMRYKNGIKAFMNSDIIYYFRGTDEPGDSGGTYTDLAFQEYFFDFNVNRKMYFRFGRQYLKWGRTSFWNPTDIINIDRKDFLDPGKNLRGAKGIKIHVPFGTRYNIYGFINVEDVGSLKDVACSGKFEFIIGDTEMALSGWYKKGIDPVLGYDFSARLFRIDWKGEMSLTRGNTIQSLLNGNTHETPADSSNLISENRDEWIPKICIGFSKTFRLMDINDRISIAGEVYYNRSGLSHNIFHEQDRVDSLLSKGLYEPNHIARYYASLFFSINRFIVADSTLNLNYITNLTDKSGIFYISCRYNLRNDFFAELSFSQSIGNGRDEYTFSGNDKIFRFELRYRF